MTGPPLPRGKVGRGVATLTLGVGGSHYGRSQKMTKHPLVTRHSLPNGYNPKHNIQTFPVSYMYTSLKIIM